MKPYRPLHLSASQIAQYLYCPASFYWNRIENIFLPASPAMLFGSAMHFALEAYHRGTNPYAAFATRWLAYRKQLDVAGTPYGEGYATAGPALLALYEDDPLPDGEPEVPWLVRLPGVPVPIRGVYDLMGEGWIGEHKTAGWAWGTEKLDAQFQKDLYQVVYPLVAKRPLDHLTYTILSCNPSPSLKRSVTHVQEGTEQKVVDTCNVVLSSMAAGIWTPRCPPSQCRYPGESFCPLLRAVQERASEAPQAKSDSVEVTSGTTRA